MTGVSGTTHSSIFTLINYAFGNAGVANGTAPNIASLYPSGNYTLTFTGNGTITVGNDAAAVSGQTPSSGSSISGNSLTISDGGTHSFVVNVATPSNNGLKVSISGIAPNATSYPIAIDLRQSIYAPGGAQYSAGEIFDPNFLAKITPYSRIRFMDWCQVNKNNWMQFNAVLAAGATSGTLTAAWPYASGTVQMTLSTSTAQVVTATMTANSTDVTFTPALTSIGNYNGSANSSSMSPLSQTSAFVPRIANWASRPLPSNVSYCNYTGVPLEVMVQLANETACDAWLCSFVMYDATYVTNMATLVMNGTGAQAGFNGGSFTGLNPAYKAYVELGNENWNGCTANNYQYCKLQGAVNFPTATAGSAFNGSNFNADYACWEWFGMQTAIMADAWFSVYGSTAFSARVVVSMPGQYTNNAVAIQALKTPDWSQGPASSHHISAAHIAPYVGSILSTADAATMEAQADPLSCFFQLLTSDTYNGTTFSSVTAKSPNGYLGYTQTQVASARTALNNAGFTSLQLLGYETGTSFTLSGTSSANDATYLGIIVSFHRDTRINNFMQLYETTLLSAGMKNVNHFTDCTAITTGGEWGAYENAMQQSSGSLQPPKAAGLLAWIG